MKRWPCDVCDGPIISLGESNVTCPRAHRHRVCVDCQRLMFGKPYTGHESDPIGLDTFTARHFEDGGLRWERAWRLKIARCPADISDADRSMWTLAGRRTTPASGTWEDVPTTPI